MLKRYSFCSTALAVAVVAVVIAVMTGVIGIADGLLNRGVHHRRGQVATADPLVDLHRVPGVGLVVVVRMKRAEYVYALRNVGNYRVLVSLERDRG